MNLQANLKFKMIKSESYIDHENNVNKWLKENAVDICQISDVIGSVYIVTFIYYY